MYACFLFINDKTNKLKNYITYIFCLIIGCAIYKCNNVYIKDDYRSETRKSKVKRRVNSMLPHPGCSRLPIPHKTTQRVGLETGEKRFTWFIVRYHGLVLRSNSHPTATWTQTGVSLVPN